MSSNRSAANTALKTASAIRNIVKGAAIGGLHGAAVGAVKSFLPEIMKAAVIIIAAVIILPTLIFAALPNILFGFDNAYADDIIRLTDKAYSIDAAYKEIENYNRDEIERLTNELTASYRDEYGMEPDEIELTANTDNTNIYWFIAITSVAHKQNLYAMDENTIRSMTIGKIIFKTSIFSTFIGEGDGAIETKTLKIDIEDLEPDKLMEKLGFTEEERNWAHILYKTLAEEQHVGIADSDGEGYYGTDYGAISFTDAATTVVYYNQTDSRWGGIKYGKTGTISTSGCGPTALAIAVATFADSSITPKEVAKWAADNGYRCEGNGSYHNLIPEGAEHYGLTAQAIGRDADKLVEALQSGKLVIAIMSKGHFTKGGHFIVLRGVTAEGKILVADPSSIKRSNQEWNLCIILNEASRKAGAGGPFWELGI